MKCEISDCKSIEILLVEDNPGDVRLIEEVLQEGKIHNHMSQVPDGVEALAYLRGKGKYANAPKPDLILLDLNLPKRNGREVLAEIKTDPELRRIPVVVITSSKAERDIVESYDNHVNCYITKPVNLEQFMSVATAVREFWLTIVKLPPS